MRRGLRPTSAICAFALLFVASVTVGCRSGRVTVVRAPKESRAPSDPSPRDAIVALNETARSSYRAAKGRILAHLGPTILVEGNKLVFLPRRGSTPGCEMDRVGAVDGSSRRSADADVARWKRTVPLPGSPFLREVE